MFRKGGILLGMLGVFVPLSVTFIKERYQMLERTQRLPEDRLRPVIRVQRDERAEIFILFDGLTKHISFKRESEGKLTFPHWLKCQAEHRDNLNH